MKTYRGIEFAEGYNKPFAEFKDEFGSNHIFNEFPPEEREKELKKAHKIATDGNTIGPAKKGKEDSTPKPE